MSDFENAIKRAAESSLLKIISEGQWIAPDYANRFKIPGDLMARVYALVDTDAVCSRMAERLNEELADRIVNHLAAEISADVKQILSNKERREALRSIARQHIGNVAALALDSMAKDQTP